MLHPFRQRVNLPSPTLPSPLPSSSGRIGQTAPDSYRDHRKSCLFINAAGGAIESSSFNKNNSIMNRTSIFLLLTCLLAANARAQNTLRMNSNQRLDKGQKIEVAGKGYLTMQTDGNLVAYTAANVPLNGRPARMPKPLPMPSCKATATWLFTTTLRRFGLPTPGTLASCWRLAL